MPKSTRSRKPVKKPTRKPAPARGAAAKRPAKRVPVKAAKPARRAKAVRKPATKAPRAHAGCLALDPFGAPCQNTPRVGSRYCGIHSHLESKM
jgi:hypothetical protein